jgi:hypothetical protein
MKQTNSPFWVAHSFDKSIVHEGTNAVNGTTYTGLDVLIGFETEQEQKQYLYDIATN